MDISGKENRDLPIDQIGGAQHLLLLAEQFAKGCLEGEIIACQIDPEYKLGKQQLQEIAMEKFWELVSSGKLTTSELIDIESTLYPNLKALFTGITLNSIANYRNNFTNCET